MIWNILDTISTVLLIGFMIRDVRIIKAQRQHIQNQEMEILRLSVNSQYRKGSTRE